MRKLIILTTMVLLLFSCSENEVNGFDAASIKKQVVSAMDKSVWVAYSPEAYYSKIIFDNEIIEVTMKSGSVERCAFQISNVTAPLEEIPEYLELRLKSGLFVNVISLRSDYSTLESIIKEKEDEEDPISYSYKKVVN